MARRLDSIDRRILEELQKDGRLPIVALAQRVHLTKTPCAERVKRLERDGYIRGYRAELDPLALDMGTTMVVQVTLDHTSDTALDDFNRAVQRIPEVRACFLLAGHFDYLLLVRTSDITHYRTVLGDEIGKLPGVQLTHSFIALETVKDSPELPLS